jgi:hypothetical protein
MYSWRSVCTGVVHTVLDIGIGRLQRQNEYIIIRTVKNSNEHQSRCPRSSTVVALEFYELVRTRIRYARLPTNSSSGWQRLHVHAQISIYTIYMCVCVPR